MDWIGLGWFRLVCSCLFLAGSGAEVGMGYDKDRSGALGWLAPPEFFISPGQPLWDYGNHSLTWRLVIVITRSFRRSEFGGIRPPD